MVNELRNESQMWLIFGTNICKDERNRNITTDLIKKTSIVEHENALNIAFFRVSIRCFAG